MRTLAILAVLAAAPTVAFGQLLAAREAPVAMGHHHFTVSDIEAETKFWRDGLGATIIKVGNIPTIRYPNALILLREGEPAGGSKGSAADHMGVGVPDVYALVAKLKAAGYPIRTKEEISGGRATEDVFHSPDQDIDLAYTFSPGGIKIELVEHAGQTVPIVNHHVHLAGPDVAAMRSWYAETFGAEATTRGMFHEAVVPGVRVTFTPSDSAVPTKGRAFDHIGFEVANLEAFCKKLEGRGIEFEVPYREVPALGISIAFLIDPWGTRVELTDGLRDVE